MPSDFFLKIDGVQGESTDAKHKGEIDVFSWSWGESNPVIPEPDGAGMRTGKPNVSSLNLMTRFSKASPVLLEACLTGQRFATAVLTGRNAGGKAGFEYLTFSLSEVAVESIQESASAGGDDSPTESVSLAFATFRLQYRQQNPDGTPGGVTQVGWDLTQNQPNQPTP